MLGRHPSHRLVPLPRSMVVPRRPMTTVGLFISNTINYYLMGYPPRTALGLFRDPRMRISPPLSMVSSSARSSRCLLAPALHLRPLQVDGRQFNGKHDAVPIAGRRVDPEGGCSE